MNDDDDDDEVDVKRGRCWKAGSTCPYCAAASQGLIAARGGSPEDSVLDHAADTSS